MGQGILSGTGEHKKTDPYLALQFVLCVLSLAYILTCPGNALRTAAETEHWFPAYAAFGVFKKAELGISYTLKTLFLQDNIWFLIFLVLLAAGIWLKYDRWIYKAAGIFLLGLMTRAMMGFSPTIWMSGGRTAICLMKTGHSFWRKKIENGVIV